MSVTFKSTNAYENFDSLNFELTMKLNNPVKIVPTDQAGFQVSGWKSEILRHSRVLVLNRPLGVII